MTAEEDSPLPAVSEDVFFRSKFLALAETDADRREEEDCGADAAGIFFLRGVLLPLRLLLLVVRPMRRPLKKRPLRKKKTMAQASKAWAHSSDDLNRVQSFNKPRITYPQRWGAPSASRSFDR